MGTEVDKEEVRLMASDPDHHYLDLVSQGYNNLVPKAPALLEKICTGEAICRPLAANTVQYKGIRHSHSLSAR